MCQGGAGTSSVRTPTRARARSSPHRRRECRGRARSRRAGSRTAGARARRCPARGVRARRPAACDRPTRLRGTAATAAPGPRARLDHRPREVRREERVRDVVDEHPRRAPGPNAATIVSRWVAPPATTTASAPHTARARSTSPAATPTVTRSATRRIVATARSSRVRPPSVSHALGPRPRRSPASRGEHDPVDGPGAHRLGRLQEPGRAVRPRPARGW